MAGYLADSRKLPTVKERMINRQTRLYKKRAGKVSSQGGCYRRRRLCNFLSVKISLQLSQLVRHRIGADPHAAGKLIFDPQSIAPNFLRPCASCRQCNILSCTEQIVCRIAPQNAGAEYQNFHDYFLLFLSGFCGIPPHPGIRDEHSDTGLCRRKWYSRTCNRPHRYLFG